MSLKILIILIIISLAKSDTPYCPDSLIITKNSFNNFIKIYKPPQLDQIYKSLKSLMGSVCANYQLCLSDAAKCIPDLPAPNQGNCLISLKNTENLSADFANKDPSAIKGNLGTIFDKLSQYVSDCEPLLSYKKKGLSDECKTEISQLNELLTKYTDDRFKGLSGVGFLSDISLKIEKQRRACLFDPVAKPKLDTEDSCDSANDWLESIAQKLELYLDQKDYESYTAFYPFIHQSFYRASQLCKAKNIQFLQ